MPGLVQKVYGRHDAGGAVCGIYFFESREALAAVRETELAQRFPPRTRPWRSGLYDVLRPLWPDRGPYAELARTAEPPQ